MFKFRFPHKPNAKTKQARRVFFIRKRTLAIPAGLAAVCALCLITTLPSYVSAASTQRQLPIYCVQREDKVCSLTFDAAWGNASLRHTPASCLSDWNQGGYRSLLKRDETSNRFGMPTYQFPSRLTRHRFL